MTKPEWNRKPCGCIRATLSVGKVVIRCTRHESKPSKKRLVCHWKDGIVVRS